MAVTTSALVPGPETEPDAARALSAKHAPTVKLNAKDESECAGRTECRFVNTIPVARVSSVLVSHVQLATAFAMLVRRVDPGM